MDVEILGSEDLQILGICGSMRQKYEDLRIHRLGYEDLRIHRFGCEDLRILRSVEIEIQRSEDS